MEEITGDPGDFSRAQNTVANHGCGEAQSRLSAHGARGAAAAGHPGVAAALSGFSSTATDAVSRLGQVMDTSREIFRVAGGGYQQLSTDVQAQSGDEVS